MYMYYSEKHTYLCKIVQHTPRCNSSCTFLTELVIFGTIPCSLQSHPPVPSLQLMGWNDVIPPEDKQSNNIIPPYALKTCFRPRQQQPTFIHLPSARPRRLHKKRRPHSARLVMEKSGASSIITTLVCLRF